MRRLLLFVAFYLCNFCWHLTARIFLFGIVSLRGRGASFIFVPQSHPSALRKLRSFSLAYLGSGYWDTTVQLAFEQIFRSFWGYSLTPLSEFGLGERAAHLGIPVVYFSRGSKERPLLSSMQLSFLFLGLLLFFLNIAALALLGLYLAAAF